MEEGEPRKRGPAPKRRGHPRDSPEVRLSKSLSWLLRHGAEKSGLSIRQDGYAKVADVLANSMFRDVTFQELQQIVKRDQKSRYHLLFEPQTSESSGTDVWWIRANQGHSMKNVELDLKPILSASEIPMAVHGTTRPAWQSIAIQGLSKMKRNHIHLAQDVAGSNVVSGMRNSSQILIFVNVQKALDAGIEFYLSTNGVRVTAGRLRGIRGIPLWFYERLTDQGAKYLSMLAHCGPLDTHIRVGRLLGIEYGGRTLVLIRKRKKEGRKNDEFPDQTIENFVLPSTSQVLYWDASSLPN
ncbi:KptA family-domain-containing protein, partial [Chiua virens]